MEIQCKVLESKQSNKFLFVKVEFTKSYFFGLWNQSEVNWVYINLLSTGDPVGYFHLVDGNEYVFTKYGSKVETFLSRKAKVLTKEHQKFKEHLETQFLIAE